MTPFLKEWFHAARSRCREHPLHPTLHECFSYRSEPSFLHSPGRNSRRLPAEEFPSGVVQELWFGIPGGSVKDLTHQKVFERPSSDIRKIVRLDAENLGDQYGARYSALLRVPATGEYRLYLSSDDSAELWLGKDATQKDMSCIATVKGYSDRHNWTNQPNQSSEPVHLEAGKFYFLQVIHKEDGGPDHMSVAWSGPGIPSPCWFPRPPCSFLPACCRRRSRNPRI